ncbi:MAG: pyridoxine 5'-phosphate synthase [Candidatus Omnitrophica bacterium]|nr:pyridoxine 5'-phosphate synthase [Candidatus Omnitrophota bacterium]
MRLGVNVDHVATIRQARGGKVPDPVWAAAAAQQAGCDSIVCHLREDRRHIQERDLWAAKKVLTIPLNLEMGAHPDIVRIACRLKPERATLVPERRQELTTEGGLNLKREWSRVERAVARMRKAGIRVSLFIDPDPVQIALAQKMEVPIVELHTGSYADAGSAAERTRCLQQLKSSVREARSRGLIVAAGHGLDYDNVRAVAAIEGIEELNIGFSIVARAIGVGIHQAVREMIGLIREDSS